MHGDDDDNEYPMSETPLPRSSLVPVNIRIHTQYSLHFTHVTRICYIRVVCSYDVFYTYILANKAVRVHM